MPGFIFKIVARIIGHADMHKTTLIYSKNWVLLASTRYTTRLGRLQEGEIKKEYIANLIGRNS